MARITVCSILGLWIAVIAVPSTTWGQLRGSLGGGVRGGDRGPGGGLRGGSYRTRSGFGFQNNPIANPAPTLTPHQIFNPRGSLSAGQVLNPAPSLSRPRSGVPLSRVNRIDRTERQSMGRAATGTRSTKRTVTPSPADKRIEQLAAVHEQQLKQNVPAGELIRAEMDLRAAQLERELNTYPNGDRWIRYFSLPDADPGKAEAPGGAGEELKFQRMLARFEKVSSNSKFAEVSSLPTFQAAHSTLVALTKVHSTEESKTDPAETNENSQTRERQTGTGSLP